MMRFLSVLAVASAVLCLAVSMAISPKAPYPLTVFELQAENPPSKDINMKENVMNLHQGKWDINQATAEQLMQVEGIGEKRAQKILQYLYRKGGIFRHGAAAGNRRNRRRAAQPNKGTVHRRIKTALRCKKSGGLFSHFPTSLYFSYIRNFSLKRLQLDGMKVLLVEQLFKLSNRQAVGVDGGGKFFGIHRVQVVERLDPWKDGGKRRRQRCAASSFALRVRCRKEENVFSA